jgi:hypothetical protein
MNRVEDKELKGQVDLKAWPRTYALDPVVRRGFDAIAFAPLGLVTGVTLLHLLGMPQNTTLPGLFAAAFLTALCGFFLSRFNRRQVILNEDSIAVVGWRSARVLKRNEILGRRGLSTRYGYFRVIVPVDPVERELRLPPNLKLDKWFFAWMNDIPQISRRKQVAHLG